MALVTIGIALGLIIGFVVHQLVVAYENYQANSAEAEEQAIRALAREEMRQLELDMGKLRMELALQERQLLKCTVWPYGSKSAAREAHDERAADSKLSKRARK